MTYVQDDLPMYNASGQNFSLYDLDKVGMKERLLSPTCRKKFPNGGGRSRDLLLLNKEDKDKTDRVMIADTY